MKDIELLIEPPEGQSWLQFLEVNKKKDIPNLSSSLFRYDNVQQNFSAIYYLTKNGFYKSYEILGYTLDPPIRREGNKLYGALLYYNPEEQKDFWSHISYSYLESLLGID